MFHSLSHSFAWCYCIHSCSLLIKYVLTTPHCSGSQSTKHDHKGCKDHTMAQSTPPAPPGSEVSIQDSVFDDLRGPDIVSWGESVNNEAGTNKIGCSPPPTTSPGSKAKRCTRLKGEKRSQETQDNRNNGVCRPCRKKKQRVS